MEYGWDHPLTAARYEEFCERHERYSLANAALVEAARIEPGHRVLDFAAGTGRTTEQILPRVGARGSVVAVEPAHFMRELGRARVVDRVSWSAEIPRNLRVDRVVCGAALWQVEELPSLLERFGSLLGDDGLLGFTEPALYLGYPDRPGGGDDPELTQMLHVLASGRSRSVEATRPAVDRDTLEGWLRESGFSPEFRHFEIRFTQAMLRDWLRIPVITDALLGDLDLDARDHRIEAAYEAVDPESFRWEGWVCCIATPIR